MAITFGTVTTGQNTGASPLTYSHTVDSNTTCLIVTTSYGGSGDDVSGVTWDGNSLTKVVVSSSNAHAAFWRLTNPTPGTGNVVVTKSGSTDRGTISNAINVFGGSTATPIGDTSNAAVASGTSVSSSIDTTETGSVSLILATKRPNGGNSIAVGGSQVAISNIDQAGTASGCRAGFSYLDTPLFATNYSVSYTGGSGDEWGLVAVELVPSSALNTYTGTPANSTRIGDGSGSAFANTYIAQQFTANADGTLTSLIAYFQQNEGSPTDGLTYQIWSDNGSDSPSALISGATVNIAEASLVKNNTWNVGNDTVVTFSSPATLVNGTKYWVVTFRQGSVDASNYYNTWVTSPSSYTGGVFKRSSDASTWNTLDIDVAYKITITESGGLTNVKTFNGVTLANIKTVNGVAIADVKSINGIT